MTEDSWAEQFDDDRLVEIGHALDHVEATLPADGGGTFSTEIEQELQQSRVALLNAVNLRLGELALEACPEAHESAVMDAATTLANPGSANSKDLQEAKETLALYL